MEPWPKPTIQALPDQVAQTILERIAGGDLRPGERLPSQRELAQVFGVGLAVVREAVQRLEALNIIETTHGSGTVVRPFRWVPLIYDPSLFVIAVQRIGVRDLWETRRLIEGQIIRLAVQRATDRDLAALADVLAQAETQPVKYELHRMLNREFHLALARASQNIVLEDLLAPLLNVQVDQAEQRFTAEHSQLSWEAHRRIYDVVAARDLSRADDAIERHFQVGPVALADVTPHGPGRSRAARRKLA
jgi:GntR family transcriptional repressor for pyruvate dehydrogenase complex